MSKKIVVEIEVDVAVIAANMKRHGMVMDGERVNPLKLDEYLKGYLSGAMVSGLELNGKLDMLKIDVENFLQGKPVSDDAFWQTWNRAQNNTTNTAPFELTDATCKLVNDREGDQIVALLGVFGKPNRLGHTYSVYDKAVLIHRLESMIGNAVGEIENPITAQLDHNSTMVRSTTIDYEKSAGVLLDYEITTFSHEGKEVHEVVGLIEPSEKLKQKARNGESCFFGIRCLNEFNSPDGKNHSVTLLVAFDILREDPRY